MTNDTVVLSIAGSDPSGGAGLQSDLRTIAAHGLHGCAVVTAITVQNTRGVSRVEPLAPDLVAEQLRALLDDLRPAAIKTGMLGTAPTLLAIAEVLADFPPVPLIVDPVLVSSSGATLLEGDGAVAYRSGKLRATLITPNHDEAAALLRTTPGYVAKNPTGAARALRMFFDAVLITGGHGEGDAVDVFAAGDTIDELRGPRIDTDDDHGTGCLLTAAIACALARGGDLRGAVAHGKDCVAEGLRNAASVPTGRGWPRLPGPV